MIKEIDFGRIITNVVSAVVVIIVAGACSIVWREATTVDDRLQASEREIKVTIDVVGTTIEDLAQKFEEINKKQREQSEIMSLIIKQSKNPEITRSFLARKETEKAEKAEKGRPLGLASEPNTPVYDIPQQVQQQMRKF